MNKDLEQEFQKQYIPIIKELKEKIEVIEVALGLINSTTQKIINVEESIHDVKSKINLLEERLLNLLETLSSHLQFTEDRMGSLEKRVLALEMKEKLVKQVYNTENLKN